MTKKLPTYINTNQIFQLNYTYLGIGSTYTYVNTIIRTFIYGDERLCPCDVCLSCVVLEPDTYTYICTTLCNI